MLWRKFQLDLPYALGELAIVTIGILIALAIDQWNSDRLDRADELKILARLISDVDVDLQDYESRFKYIDEKEESLLRIQTTLSSNGPQDEIRFLNDVVIGANYGWNQGSAQRATFNDLLESGRMSIIADPEVRILIVSYYEAYETQHVRIDERETEYPHISYQIVPRGRTSDDEIGVVELHVEAGLSDAYVSERVRAAKDLAIQNHVIAEINLARFIRGVSADLQVKAKELSGRLKEYQAQIE